MGEVKSLCTRIHSKVAVFIQKYLIQKHIIQKHIIQKHIIQKHMIQKMIKHFYRFVLFCLDGAVL